MKSLMVVCVFLVLGTVQSARIARQAATPAAAAPGTTSKTDGMNVALGFMVDELDKESALGGPVNPAGLKKATILALKIQMLGGEVDKPTQDKLDSMTSDFLAEAAKPDIGAYMSGASKPDDTKVDVSQFGR